MQIDRKLRVAVDCRMANTRQGVGTAVITLAKALSDSTVADQEYTFIVYEDIRDWIAPYVYGPCKLEGIAASTATKAKASLRRIAPLRLVWHKLSKSVAHIPVSDGYVEAQRFDVVHFPTQMGYLTNLPSIYQPWDLQHLHYPQFFSKSEFEQRERYYRAFCDRALFVCVQTEWTRQDVIKHYGLPADKVVVIPWGSVFDAYKTPSTEATCATRKRHNLPSHFFFYPAVTWAHKNHEVVFRALRVLKSEHGIDVHVYFTGSSTERRSALDKLARDLGVARQVHFLGFLTPEQLQGVFSAAAAMVFASKFEGFGLPILEAFHARLPVLCSNATTLPEVAGDAALYFDPDSPEELASLMKMVLDRPEVREDLIKKGTLVLSRYSIEEIAANFRSLYDRTAELSSQGRHLCAASAGI